MTKNNNQEEKIWQEAYDKAATEIYEAEYQRLIDDGVDEKEARYIARDNADFRAKDIAYSAVSDYRKNKKVKDHGSIIKDSMEAGIWKYSYQDVFQRVYDSEYKSFIKAGIDEETAHFTAKNRAAFQAADIAYTNILSYRWTL